MPGQNRRVAIIGAGGHLGAAIASRLVHDGFDVYALVRDEEKQERLDGFRAKEITPLAQSKIGDTHFDIIIDAAATDESYKAFEQLSVPRIAKSPEFLYIFTSGVLCHGTKKGEVITEATGTGAMKDHPFFANRINTENEVMKKGGIVVRPGAIFGKDQGKLMSQMMFGNLKGEGADQHVEIHGNGDAKFSWIHVDDCADAYVRLIEAAFADGGNKVRGQDFNCTDDRKYVTHREFSEALAKAAGCKAKAVVLQEDDHFRKLLQEDVACSSKKLQDTVGWFPRHLGILDDMEKQLWGHRCGVWCPPHLKLK